MDVSCLYVFWKFHVFFKGGTIAYANALAWNDCGRPIVGYTNFCPGKRPTTEESNVHYLATALHEMVHALVLNGDFSNWRKQDGNFYDTTVQGVQTGLDTYIHFLFCVCA